MRTLDFAPKIYFSPTPATSLPHIYKWYQTHPLVKKERKKKSENLGIILNCHVHKRPSLTHLSLLVICSRKLNSTHKLKKSAGAKQACFCQSSDAVFQVSPHARPGYFHHHSGSEITITVSDFKSTCDSQGETFLGAPRKFLSSCTGTN